ncbi:hypothetical protein ACOKS3_24580 [Pseudomonas sp. HS6-2]|uniref:hypothetical protein n=1 Tax=Pseudomonas sp. HS6-2 TaxID=3410986 RepID=UPI003BE3E69A
MQVNASFGLFTFPLEPQAYGSLIHARAGDFLDIKSFDQRRSTAKLSLIESDLIETQPLVRITGAELKAEDISAKINAQRFQDRKAERSSRHRRENVTKKIYTFVHIYTNGELIGVFPEDKSALGNAAIANSGNLKFNNKDYKIDFRYIDVTYDEVTGLLDSIYWDIYLIEN